MCLYPQLILNKKYTSNQKNGGIIPPILDRRCKYVPVGCQECIECRKQKAREWQIRLQEDIKEHKNGKFITLTFSNTAIKNIIENPEQIEELKKVQKVEGYARDNQIATSAVRLWLERWRKKYKKSLRHFLITELGHQGTENIHLHGIVWTDKSLEEVERTWQYGWVWKGKEIFVMNGKIVKRSVQNYVNAKTVNYIIKYITKRDEVYTTYKSKILVTPGIGRNYTQGHDYKKNKYNGEKTDETYRTNTGHKISIPVYWRNKIYSEEEREKLWLQKLNKEERWICGEKVKLKFGKEQEYYKMLKWHQQQNIKLGYGNGEKNWQKEEYENQRRNMMSNKRMGKGEQE